MGTVFGRCLPETAYHKLRKDVGMKKRLLFLGLICLVCFGTGIICKRTLAHSALITGKPVKECSNIKVKFSYHDLPGSRKKEIAEDVAWFKEVRTKEGLKHLYDDYIASSANIGVFYVLDDSRMYTSATKGHMKLVKDISSNGELQEEDEILAVNDYDYTPSGKGSTIYETSNVRPLLRPGECYLMAYKKLIKKKGSAIFETHGVKLPQFYTINIGNYTDSSLRLSKETNYEPIQKGTIYTLKDLAEFDMFAGDKKILEEWYRTKDAILRYYVGDNYAELAANWKRKERTGNE